jgi:FaeA-like protein.
MNDLRLSHRDIMVLEKVNSASAEEKRYEGVSSREIADLCGLDIYGARYTLLKLTRLGLVKVCMTTTGLKKLLWVPVNPGENQPTT